MWLKCDFRWNGLVTTISQSFCCSWVIFHLHSIIYCFLGKSFDWKPHHKKTFLAAINSMAILVGAPNVFDHAHLYPLTHQAKQKWETHLKQKPYFPQQAAHFSREAMLAMCSLMCETNPEVLDQVAVVTACWTSLRVEDLCNTLSKNVSKILASNDAPRGWRFYLERMKNDPKGEGPPHERQFILPCICLELLTTSQAKAFKRDMKKNPQIECACACPFAVVANYMKLIPDPYGAIAASANMESPRFLRAMATKAQRKFLCTPLGKNFTRRSLMIDRNKSDSQGFQKH